AICNNYNSIFAFIFFKLLCHSSFGVFCGFVVALFSECSLALWGTLWFKTISQRAYTFKTSLQNLGKPKCVTFSSLLCFILQKC
ncbi:hypothetical protein VIGAN_10064700, partial [Vigna angularis var. angularis]